MAFAWKQKSMFLEERCKLALIVFLLYVSTACSPITAAQDAIRVEANEVLVPVLVFDKHQDQVVSNDPKNLLRAVKEGDEKRVREIEDAILIRDLTASNFQVFDDGNPQVIQNVVFQHGGSRLFRDNGGYHDESFGEGGGKWSSVDWPSWMVAFPSLGRYVISYSSPASPEGSCHNIKLTVNRPNAVVFARREYCNVKDSVSDPLNGTILGKQMESYLSSGAQWPASRKAFGIFAKDTQINLSLTALAFYTDTGNDHVYVAIEWPSQAVGDDPKALGILGMIFAKDGTLAARFSDRHEWAPAKSLYNHYGDRTLTRYEKQLTLPPGEYDVRVALNVGKKFGRTEAALVVEAYGGKGLVLSTVALCKQVQDAFTYFSQGQPKLPISPVKPRRSYVPLVSNNIEFKPTSDTRFKKGAILYTYFQVYEPSLDGQPPEAVQIQIQMRVVNVKTGELLSSSEAISAAPYVKPGNPLISIGRGIDISKLPKGSYRLEVRATDSAGQSSPWRMASFTVES